MLIRIVFTLISLLVLTQSAPSPYFTRSFVQTPGSTYEQYLIVPDKSDAYRVPMSQVHHYSDFQFPKQQVVYYNPSTHTNHHRLQALKKDNPLWEQMVMNLHTKSDENMLMSDDAEMSKMSENMEMKDNSDHKVMNEDTMRMILDQENPSSDMMEKLKRDDTKISEMMRVLEESTTLAPKTLVQPIVVASNEDAIPEEISDQTAQMDTENQETSSDQDEGPTVKNMIESMQNSTDQMLLISPQIHPEMTRVIVPNSNLPKTENDTSIEAVEALNEIQTESPAIARIAELISNVEPFEMSTIMNQMMNQDVQPVSSTEQSPLRKTKEMTLEIMKSIKDHPEIMIKIVELAAASIQEMESDLRNDSIESEERSSEQNIVVTEPTVVESTESAQSILSQKEANEVEMLELTTRSIVSESSTSSISGEFSTESTQLSTEAPKSEKESSSSTEKSVALPEISTDSTIPEVESRFDDSMNSTEKSEPEMQNSKEEIDMSGITQIPVQNPTEITENVESSSAIEELRADLATSTMNIIELIQTTELSSISSESLQTESSIELAQPEIIQSTTEAEIIQTTEAIKNIIDESTEAINTPITELTMPQESASTESSGMIQEVQVIHVSMTSKTDNSNQVNLTLAENIEQSVTRSDVPLNVNDNESNENKFSSSEEQTSSDSGEKESQEEQITLQETPQEESGETMREGRVNKAPTMFLHNNRFYVISGDPEFYANFDAYQNPRTPIFSLQELQPIRPMNNVAIQKIEPFRIYVEDNEEQKSSTQDDNEPFKMQNSTTDNPRSDIENTQSMNMEQRESEMQREMTVKVKKRVQDRQPSSEARQDYDDEEEPSVAQSNPEATSISGRGGVSSANPKGIALSNKGGISVASPIATAIAGKYKLNDSDDGIDVDFEDDVKTPNRRRVQAVKRKIIRGRRNWRM